VLALAGPPVIHEPFTVLPCPSDPQTTGALEGCAEHAILRSDARIDALAARIWKALPAAGRPAFARGERSWLAYRRSSCQAEVAKYAGGTFHPVAYGDCEQERNASHLKDLGETLRVLNQH
jgi:uncharacterized protein YecT (DUF1311 family)